MGSTHLARFAVLLLVSLTPLSVAGESWDRDRAVVLAAQLEQTLGLALAAAETATQQPTAMQQRTRDAAVIEMRRAHEYSGHYANKLRGGWDRDESEPFFDQLSRATRQARETASGAIPDPTVAPHLERMNTLLLELSKLYERD